MAHQLGALAGLSFCAVHKSLTDIVIVHIYTTPVRPEAVLPDRALCLPTFSHFLIVNKTSLSHTHTHYPLSDTHKHTYIDIEIDI